MSGDELWCQGYSEPDAGTDLANVATRAERDDGGEWVIDGQKVWTSLAHWADWCFVIARTSPPADPRRRHGGLSYLLVPMRQDGIEIRPIVQLTGDAEFNEVFFDGARTDGGNVVGGEGDGWKVAMGTLAFERGASTLGQQLVFRNELDAIIAVAKRTGAASDPVMRQRLADARIGLEIMRLNALRTLAGTETATLGREAMIAKLYWAHVAPRARRAGDGRARPRTPPCAATSSTRRVRPRRPAAPVPVQPLRHDLRRVEPDPAQHHRRARARPAAGAAAMTSPVPTSVPTEPGGHDLLRGQDRARHRGRRHRHRLRRRPGALLAEGATVVVSDAHERRLSETAAELAGTLGPTAPAAPSRWPSCATSPTRTQVQALFDAAVAAHGRLDVLVNNAGLGGTADIVDMTDEQWAKVLDVTLTGTFRCTRAALRHMRPAGLGRDREQRLGARLAGPGRPGALRRGQGGRDGA